MENDDIKTVSYRLTNIEQTLTELKNVVLENKLQARDIKDLAKKNDELINAINSHDQRIRKLEEKPNQEKAEKWQFIIDYIFKGAVVAIAAMVATKIGFN